MRVITGSARGKRLVTPSGLDTRPTVAKAKEGVFSAIQFDIEGRRVLDLFAGSGQLGIEALSRGAESCTFVDNDPKATAAIRENVENCGFSDESKIVRGDWKAFLLGCPDEFDIVFLDPPYHNNLVQQAVGMLSARTSAYCTLVCETAFDEQLPDELTDFKATRRYKYGQSAVVLYKKSDEIQED